MRAPNFLQMLDERPPTSSDDDAAHDPADQSQSADDSIESSIPAAPHDVDENAAAASNTVTRPVAPELAAGLDAARFRREVAFVSSRLEHPNIVPLIDAGERDGESYVTMPRLGEPLDTRIAREGPLPIPEVMRFLRDIASALANGHERGVLHRALTPANIFLADGSAHVAEFGVAHAADAARFTRPDPSVDNRTDIRDLGRIGYEMLTGQAPVPNPATGNIPLIRSLRSEVSTQLAHLVTRCMSPRPADRPQTASEVVAALDEMITPIDGLLTTLWPGESDTLQARAEYYKQRGIAALVIVGIAFGVLAWIAARSASGKDAARRLIGSSVIPSATSSADSTQSKAPAAAGPRGTKNDSALAAFERGQSAEKQLTDVSLHEAVADYQSALAADPRYVQAWGALAESWLLLSDEFVAPRDAVPQARDAVARGLAFDTTDASLLAARGVIEFLYDRNAHAAQTDLGRAVAQEPRLALATHWYAPVLWTNGLRDSAKAFMRGATQRDSANAQTVTEAWMFARMSGNALESIEYCGKLRVLRKAEACDAMQQLDVSNPDPEIALAGRAARTAGPRNTAAQLAYVQALVTAKRMDEAKQVAASVDQQAGIPGSYMREDDIALMHGWIGDDAGALQWLDHALVAGSAGVGALYWRTALNPLRNDPRLLDFAKRAGLESPPSYWR